MSEQAVMEDVVEFILDPKGEKASFKARHNGFATDWVTSIGSAMGSIAEVYRPEQKIIFRWADSQHASWAPVTVADWLRRTKNTRGESDQDVEQRIARLSVQGEY